MRWTPDLLGGLPFEGSDQILGIRNRTIAGGLGVRWRGLEDVIVVNVFIPLNKESVGLVISRDTRSFLCGW